MSHLYKIALLGMLVLLFASACSQESSETAAVPAPKPVSDWRVVIQLPDAELPVHLYLAPDGSEAWFINGPERVVVSQIAYDDGTWTLHFPTFANTVVLNETADGFEGSLTLVKRGYEQVMPLTATPWEEHLFFDQAQATANVTGRWAVTFIEDDGTESFAVGEFDQQGAQLVGTFLTAKGDYRYLAGEVQGKQLALSTFDGAHAFVFTASIEADGSLKGDFWSGTRWHEAWTAQRDFEAVLPDAYALTYLKPGYDRLSFTFPDLNGQPVSLDDERFRDKVVLVTLGGTWCPNCADEMEFLSGVYREHQDQGLEIISLLYEHFDEFEAAARQGRAMKEKHRLDFDVLIAGNSDKAEAAATLPMLNHVLAYPTLIFIDRKGAVRRIHTGFAGPGTGQYYERFKQAFAEQLQELLDEGEPFTGP